MDSLSLIIVALAAIALVAITVLYWYLSQPSGHGAGVAPHRERPSSSAGTSRFQEAQPTRPPSPSRVSDQYNDIATGIEQLCREVARLVESQNAIVRVLESLVDKGGHDAGTADARGDASGRRHLFPQPRKSTGERAAVTPESRAATAKQIVIDYCRGDMSLLDLTTAADHSALVWGSVNINKQQQLEKFRRGDIMAFGAETTGEAFVVVSDDCKYNPLGMGLFFNKMDASADQRVFAASPARVLLKGDGTVEPQARGVLRLA